MTPQSVPQLAKFTDAESPEKVETSPSGGKIPVYCLKFMVKSSPILPQKDL